MAILFPCNDEAGKVFAIGTPHEMLKSILLGVTGTSTFILRRGDVEAVAQGEGDTTGIVVLHLAEHHAIAIKREAIDASIEKVIA